MSSKSKFSQASDLVTITAIPNKIDVTRAVITGIIGSIDNLKIDSGITFPAPTFDAILSLGIIALPAKKDIVAAPTEDK